MRHVLRGTRHHALWIFFSTLRATPNIRGEGNIRSLINISPKPELPGSNSRVLPVKYLAETRRTAAYPPQRAIHINWNEAILLPTGSGCDVMTQHPRLRVYVMVQCPRISRCSRGRQFPAGVTFRWFRWYPFSFSYFCLFLWRCVVGGGTGRLGR